jgi:hypothetical protein
MISRFGCPLVPLYGFRMILPDPISIKVTIADVFHCVGIAGGSQLKLRSEFRASIRDGDRRRRRGFFLDGRARFGNGNSDRSRCLVLGFGRGFRRRNNDRRRGLLFDLGAWFDIPAQAGGIDDDRSDNDRNNPNQRPAARRRGRFLAAWHGQHCAALAAPELFPGGTRREAMTPAARANDPDKVELCCQWRFHDDPL